MELTEWVVEDIWNQNKPNEVRAKYYLSDLIRMLRRKMVGTLSTILAAASMAKRRHESGVASMMRGAGAQLSPRLSPAQASCRGVDPSPLPDIVNARDAMTAEPLDSPDQAVDPFPQPEIVKARDAIAVEPLDSPDGREKRGRGSRIPSSDGAIVSGS